MATKEKWDLLTDEEKTLVIRRFMERSGLKDFDYKKEKERYNELKDDNMKSSIYPGFKNPCIVLEMVDPILTSGVMSWFYSRDIEHNIQVPFFGYSIEELVFDKSSLMSYTLEEKQILDRAIEILKNKGVKNG